MEGKLSYWLPPNWTWKLEYLYLDLGSIDTTTPFALLTQSALSNLTGTITTHTHFTDNIPAAHSTATSLRRARLARASN
jgi:hypothetical protein